VLVARPEGRTAAVLAVRNRADRGSRRVVEACGQGCGCESQSGGEEEGRKMHFCGYCI
jgi:hypothetical protein